MEIGKIFGFIMFMCLCFGLLVYISMSIGNRVGLLGEIAQITQLKNDIKKASILSNEDIMGQVTVWNQKIAFYKAYNNIWWADILISDKWNSIEYIPVK